MGVWWRWIAADAVVISDGGGTSPSCVARSSAATASCASSSVSGATLARSASSIRWTEINGQLVRDVHALFGAADVRDDVRHHHLRRAHRPLDHQPGEAPPRAARQRPRAAAPRQAPRDGCGAHPGRLGLPPNPRRMPLGAPGSRRRGAVAAPRWQAPESEASANLKEGSLFLQHIKRSAGTDAENPTSEASFKPTAANQGVSLRSRSRRSSTTPRGATTPGWCARRRRPAGRVRAA